MKFESKRFKILCKAMTLKAIWSLSFCFIVSVLNAQQSVDFKSDSLAHYRALENKNVSLSAGNVAIDQNNALAAFFQKLSKLNTDKEATLNIVHIGDSHIQAGFLTGRVRDTLQTIFGNAGLGFTFPYRLAKSNGISAIRYRSSAAWQSKRNLYASDIEPVGLSGFSFRTEAKDFAVNLKIEDERYYFKGLKLFTPYADSNFEVAETDHPVNMENWTTTYKTHRIQSGEVLGIIARKYGVSIAQIKAANNLRSTLIRAGATLKIPVRTQKPLPLDRSQFKILQGTQMPGYVKINSENPLKSVWLLPQKENDSYALNGIFLDNNSSGIIYSGIGVNGARYKDFNKTPLFFEQLPYLEPDLLVVSLGTNEAYGHTKTTDFMADMDTFITKVKDVLPDTPIIITTPSPMLDRRTHPSTLIEDYATSILNYGKEHDIAVYNLFKALGGNQKIRSNYNKGWYHKDYIHFTKKGYEHSADLFAESFLNAFYQTLYKPVLNEL